MVAARLFDWILHPIRMRYLSYFRLHAFNVWPPNFNIIWLFRYDDKKITSHFEAWHWNIRSLGLRFPNYQISILIFSWFFFLFWGVCLSHLKWDFGHTNYFIILCKTYRVFSIYQFILHVFSMHNNSADICSFSRRWRKRFERIFSPFFI